jgi:hypothetical protein
MLRGAGSAFRPRWAALDGVHPDLVALDGVHPGLVALVCTPAWSRWCVPRPGQALPPRDGALCCLRADRALLLPTATQAN